MSNPTTPVLDNMPNEAWTIYQLVKSIQQWGNAVKFASYERRLGRPGQNDQWMEDVGVRIDAACDILMTKLRDAKVIDG